MKKSEKIRLLALAKRLDKLAEECDRWNRKNQDKCGHSNSSNSLGDEGWHTLWHYDGQSRAFKIGANSLRNLINKFKIEGKK